MPSDPTALTLDVERIANGGEGVAHEPDGRVVFVPGALPGERVTVELVEERPRHARARLLGVVRPSLARREPPCPHVAEGCGGCDWQHATEAAQRDLRLTIVTDALERIGRVTSPVVVAGPALPSEGLRTTIRAVVTDGRAGYRRRASHDPVVVDSCLIAHPLVEEVLVAGRFGEGSEIVVRAGARTGERMVIVEPSADGVVVPDGVRVVGADELAEGTDAWIHEEAAGRRWRISAGSFFQSSPEGAEALVAAVNDAVAAVAPDATRAVDLCAGVGLFAGTLPIPEVVAVESSRAAIADATVNLADLDVTIIRSRLERWRPEAAPLVVADPPRAGLGRVGVEKVEATGADAVVLVSCDAGALGRDVRLLTEAGYVLEQSVVLDLFPQTSHVEVVSRLIR